MDSISNRKRVLVTWGSKRGGTEGIGRIIADELARHGFDVVSMPAHDVRTLEGFDAVVVGGALYAFRWTPEARRFVRRNVRALRRVPVWFFSSGPLDDSANREEIEPTKEVAVLGERVGAKGHATFGGRLEPDAKGFGASAMAKKNSGDWRDRDRIAAWANRVAAEIPEAAPGPAIDHPAHSSHRLLGHALIGWAACLAVLLALWPVSATLATVLHAIVMPIVFVGIAVHYFRGRGAREPLPVAIVFAGVAAVLDVGVIAVLERSFDVLASLGGTWVPVAVVFLGTWIAGAMMAMDLKKNARDATRRAQASARA